MCAIVSELFPYAQLLNELEQMANGTIKTILVLRQYATWVTTKQEQERMITEVLCASLSNFMCIFTLIIVLSFC